MTVPATGLPALGDVPVPAAVREAGAEDAYRTALGFEGLLLEHLAEQLVQDAGLDDSPHAASMTGAFSAALLQGGGVGMAEDLWRSFAEADR